MQGCPSSFGRIGESKGVREGFRATRVDRADLSFAFAFGFYVFWKFMAVRDTQVIQVGLDFRMIVARQRDLEFGIGLLDDFDCFAHGFHRTFVHRDGSLFKPAFFTQVTGEVFQERTPVFGIFGIARFDIDKLYPAGRFIVIVESQSPRDHGVATDHIFDPHFVHHEFHPFVKYVITVYPCPVDFLDTGYHAVEMVFRLAGPRFMHDAGRDGPLSGIGQHLHDRKHGVEMLLAPKRNLVVTGYGIGILPQVQMESPVLRSWQRTVLHVDFYLEFHILEILS